MNHELTVTVPEDVYRTLVEQGLRHGRTPEQEASLRLQCFEPCGNDNRKRGALRELFGSVDLGYLLG